jgi:hypothetical protein
MDCYQFIVKTYNHEKYILDYLSSLKFQILTYHPKYPVILSVVDDNSVDKTIKIVDEFKQLNLDLFYEFEVFVSDINKGINLNQKKAVSLVKTKLFHIMDGDDLYSPNNVFDFIDLSFDYDYTFSPNYHLHENDNPLIRFPFLGYFKIMHYKDKLSILKKYNPIPNPGSKVSINAIKYNEKLGKNLQLEMNLSNFFEKQLPLSGGDHLAWLILFKENKMTFVFSESPIVIYRRSSGVTNNKLHPNYFEVRKHKLIEFYGEKMGKLFTSNSIMVICFLRLKYKFEQFIYLVYNFKKLDRFLHFNKQSKIVEKYLCDLRSDK